MLDQNQGYWRDLMVLMQTDRQNRDRSCCAPCVRCAHRHAHTHARTHTHTPERTASLPSQALPHFRSQSVSPATRHVPVPMPRVPPGWPRTRSPLPAPHSTPPSWCLVITAQTDGDSHSQYSAKKALLPTFYSSGIRGPERWHDFPRATRLAAAEPSCTAPDL